jgi:crossover junction endodeoxyribonuclease RusA
MWMQENALKTNLWRNKNGWQTSQYKTVVKLWFYFPDHRRRDTHNSLKILMDTLEKAQIFVDDKYALPQIIDYSIDKKNPRVEMEFQKVE